LRRKSNSELFNFALGGKLCHFVAMSKPLALVYYSNLLPGSQLCNRLQDLGYRVQSLEAVAMLPPACESEKPLVVIAELVPATDACAAITQLKHNPATQHVPVLAFSPVNDATTQAMAVQAGVALLAGNAAISEQLPQLLDQILQIE
jgi:PleD family two-component response regulator